MTPAVQAALTLGLLEEMHDELRDELVALAKPTKPAEPVALNYGLLADFVMSRIEPRLQLLEERSARIEASLAILKIRARRSR